jgi:signal recognition particle receptor subunit beta
MVQINFAQKEIQCKIVYYGPGMSGKTTNLEVVHGKVPSDSRGELTSIATTGERTLYFDYMPLDLGQIAGICTKFQLYTVPGQIYYKSTRRLVLQGVDGIVFVADSSKAKLRENLESFEDLEQNLKEMGKSLTDVPIIIQYNKRDLPDAMTIEELEKEVNPHGFPYTEAIATKGDGIFPTLKELSELVLEAVNKSGFAATRPKRAPRPAAKVEADTASVAEPVAAGASSSVVSRPMGGAPDVAVQRNPLPPAGKAPSRPPPPSGGGKQERSPSSGGHMSSVSHAGSMPKSATPPPANNYSQRAMQDRVVQVSGLGGGGGSRLVVLGGLGLLIAAAVYFVVTKVL